MKRRIKMTGKLVSGPPEGELLVEAPDDMSDEDIAGLSYDVHAVAKWTDEEGNYISAHDVDPDDDPIFEDDLVGDDEEVGAIIERRADGTIRLRPVQ